jgi:hypothetical protein
MTTPQVLNPESDYRPPYVVNPLYAKFPEPTRPAGRAHQNGTCGYMASLCSRCHEIETRWHVRVAEAIGREYPPLPGESTMTYWRRVGGRHLDTWPEAVTAAFRAAGITDSDRLRLL